jgi:PAS domain S-box-containing protein
MGAGAGTESALDPVGCTPAELEEVVDALDRLARLLPDGHELFTAVSDRRAKSSDLLLRNSSGITAVRLGLADADREQLAAVIARLSQGFLGRPRFPAELLPPGPVSQDPELEVAGDQPAEDRPAVNEAAVEAKPAEPGAAQAEPSRAQSDEADGTAAQLGGEPGVDFRAIVEECPLPLMIIAADGMIEYAAPAFVPALGVETAAALEGLSLAQLLHPEDRERVARVIDLTLDRLDSLTLSVRLRRWDGSLLRAEIALRGLPDHERLILAVGASSSPRNGLDELLASEQRQRALANAADAGTALISTVGDCTGALVDLNPQFATVLGAAGGALVGATLAELVDAGDAGRVDQALRAVTDGRGVQRLEVRLGGESGRRVSLNLGLDRSSGDPPSLATVLVHDLIEQNRPLGELNRTVERLEQQNRELAEFARVTAHDLMAPLRALSGLMDVLAPQLEETSEDALLAVQTAISRMLVMVDGAVGFADAQARAPEHGPVDLSAVVDRVLAMLGSDIVGTGADISVGELPVVSGDDIQLERLLASLISNALSYSGEDPPQIEISAVPVGTMWQITVADEGIGVDPEARESIFALFERRVTGAERSSLIRAGSGYGIGLATARQIAAQHGGRIWVEPNRPRGSVFAFTVPGR